MRGGGERFISNLENYNNGEKEKGGEEDNDPNFDRKLDLITAGGQPFVKENLLTKITRPNCQIIINYILVIQTEVSPSQTYRIGTINKLKYFAEFLIARWINSIMFI